MRRLLILGASHFQVPAIRKAIDHGHFVITCDYLPQNPGHKLSHKNFNVSTTDKRAVLKLARELDIDGILAYASDPAAPTAAFVANSLGLPSSTYEAITTLTHKHRFREFQSKIGLCCPATAIVRTIEEAQQACKKMDFPVVIKPLSSSGSKGVSTVGTAEEIAPAVVWAQSITNRKSLIVETFIKREGQQIAGDGVLLNGHVQVFGFADEHFSAAVDGLAPIGETFPARISETVKGNIIETVEQLFSALGIADLVFNLDAVILPDGQVFIIEIGPRAGGNLIPQAMELHAGCNITQCAIDLALGIIPEPESYQYRPRNPVATWIIHGHHTGTLKSIRFTDKIRPFLRNEMTWAKAGDEVSPFRSSQDGLGATLLEFTSTEQMHDVFSNMSSYIDVTFFDQRA